MTHITVSVQVAVSSDNEDWEIVDTPAPGHVNGNDGVKSMNLLGTDVGMRTVAPDHDQVKGKDRDKRLVRFLGKYVIKRRAGLSAALSGVLSLRLDVSEARWPSSPCGVPRAAEILARIPLWGKVCSYSVLFFVSTRRSFNESRKFSSQTSAAVLSARPSRPALWCNQERRPVPPLIGGIDLQSERTIWLQLRS